MKAVSFRDKWWVYDDDGHEVCGPFLAQQRAEEWIAAQEKIQGVDNEMR